MLIDAKGILEKFKLLIKFLIFLNGRGPATPLRWPTKILCYYKKILVQTLLDAKGILVLNIQF